MNRSFYLMAVLALTALASSALAGEMIIVEEVATPTADTRIDTRPLDKVTELSSTHKSFLSRAISVGCWRKARSTPELIELSQRTGNDSPRLYCNCMSEFMAKNLSVSMLKSVATTRAMPPELQDAAMSKARQCMQLAAR